MSANSTCANKVVRARTWVKGGILATFPSNVHIFKQHQTGTLVSLFDGFFAHLHLFSNKKYTFYRDNLRKRADSILVLGDKAILATRGSPLKMVCLRTFRKIREIRHKMGSLNLHSMETFQNHLLIPELDIRNSVLLKIELSSGEVARRVVLEQLR